MDHQHVIIGKDISPKLAATAILSQAGFSKIEQAEAFGITRQRVGQIQKELSQNLRIDSKKRIKAAARAADLILAGLPVGEAQIKGSDVLGAMKEVYSRAQPTQSKDVQAGGASYTQVNINIYRS